MAHGAVDVSDFEDFLKSQQPDVSDFDDFLKKEKQQQSAPIDAALKTVPRPALPKMDTVDVLSGEKTSPTPKLVQTSPYSPGAVPTFEPVGGEQNEESAATNAGARAGTEQALGVHGYPKIVKGVKKLAESGVRPGSTYYTPPQTEMTPEQLREGQSGIADVARGVGEAATPLIAEAAGANPVGTALGFGAGYGASEGIGSAVHGKVSPEAEDAIRQIAFWAPGLAATAIGLKGFGAEGEQGSLRGVEVAGGRAGGFVARSPEGATTVGGKFGPFSGSKTFGGPAEPAGPALEPPTIEGEVPPAQPPSPTPPPQSPAVNDAASGMVQANAAEATAGRVASGLPPEPPQPVAPPPPPLPHVSPEMVEQLGGAIAKLPPDIRAQAILETHGTLAKVLLNQGKFVGPDGLVQVVENEKQASKLAQKLINDQVQAHDEKQEEAAKPENHVVDDDLVAKLQSEHDANSGPLAAQPESHAGTRREAGTAVPSGSARGSLGNSGEIPSVDGKLPSTKSEGYAKGDTVTLKSDIVRGDKTYKAGTQAEVTWASAPTGGDNRQPILRLKTADGNKISLGPSQIQKGEAKPLHKNASTQVNLPDDVSKQIQQVGKKVIPDSDLASVEGSDSSAAKGREGQPHITVKYGVDEGKVEKLRASLAKVAPFDASLGKIRTFPPTENSDGAAVVHAEVKSPELQKLHKSVHEAIGNKEDDFDYKPHVTLAYVKPEVAHKYEGRSDLEGTKIPVKSIHLSKRNGEQVEVPLGGAHEAPVLGTNPNPPAERQTISPAVGQEPVVAGAPARTAEGESEAKGAVRPKAEIDRDIDALVSKAEAARGAAKDQQIRGLRPAAVDWMSDEDLDKLHALQLERHPYTAEEMSPELARQRVAEKRAARQAEEESSKRENLGMPPRAGEVGTMRTSAIQLDPKRFQYKLSTDAEGVGTLLKNTKVFNPDLADQISVWKDPANGKTFVVNGHHRLELAKRTGTKTLVVRHIKAANATAARAIGAMQNIAGGRGTALDAAKFMRDTATTPEHLEERGVSLGEKTAADGVALSHLDTPIFNKVVSGDLRQGRAVAIGEATSDPAEQKAILALVDKKEAKGGKVSDDTLKELIRLVKSSGQTTETTADLFGVQQINRSLALEKAEVSAHIKQQLAKDKKLFGFVAKESRAQELERAGNKIDVEKSKEISTGAAQAEEVYNKLSSRGGPIQTILDESAQRLADGDNAAAVKSEAYQRVRAEVSKTLGSGTERDAGRPEGVSKDTETPEGGSGEPEGSIDLFSVPHDRYSVSVEDGYVKVRHPEHGTVAAGRMDSDGRVRDIEFTDPKFQKSNAIRQPAMRALQEFERNKPSESTNLFSPDNAPVFYSKAERVATEKLPNSASGDAILATLKNSGVKADEMKWLGLDDLAGKPKVSKAEVLERIRENDLQVKDVTKGGPRGVSQEERELQSHIDELSEEKANVDFRIDYDHPEKWTEETRILVKKSNSLSMRRAELRNKLTLFDAERTSPTKFQQYTLPGEKKNYTELLMTLPDDRGKASAAKTARIRELTESRDRLRAQLDKERSIPELHIHEGRDSWLAKDSGGSVWGEVGKGTVGSAEEAKTYLERYIRQRESENSHNQELARQLQNTETQLSLVEREPSHDPTAFRSGHFDEPNILAHVRFDERTDADGKRVLLVEEVQSDWHQKGKREGYNFGRRWFVRDRSPERALLGTFDSEQKANDFAWDNRDKGVQVQHVDSTSSVPDAPFKSDWHELAMKRMLREAAEQGYDKLAWVTGEQTADRYDLSKRIDGVQYDAGIQMLTAIRDDAVVLSKRVKPEEIADYIGKEPAHRLLAATPINGQHQLKNADLRIGATWATNLYDRAIPNFLTKYGKKWGVKVGTTVIPLADMPASEYEKYPANHPYVQKNRPTVHAIDVTPEMKKSVLEEGQPLFRPATGPIEPGTAKKMEFSVRPTVKGQPPYLRTNGEATNVIARAVGVNFKGLNLDPEHVKQIATKLRAEAHELTSHGHAEAARKLNDLADTMMQHNDPDKGLHLVRANENAAEELRTLHEEMIHGVQRGAGKGDIAKGVPWRETMSEPGMARMASERIVPELVAHGISPHPVVIVAEGFVDVMRGDAASELTPGEAFNTAAKYFEALAARGDIQSLEEFQQVQDYIADEENKRGIAHNREVLATRRAGEKALARAISESAGATPRGIGGAVQSQPVKGTGETNPAGEPENTGPPNDAGKERDRGAPNAGKDTGNDLASTANVGLNDEELESWAKNKAFRVEPAGEQLGMFGDSDKVFRVFRTVGKQVQTGLVYENQLDRAGISKEGPQQTSLGLSVDENAPKPWESDGQTSLFRGDSGSLEPGKISEAAGAVRDFLKEAAKNISVSRELQSGMYGLESQYSADVLRAVQTMKAVVKDLGGKKEAQRDLEAVYHHLENPEEPLTPAQDKVLDNTILPLMDESDRIFKKLTQGGVPAENYVHRVVRGKGGFLDRIARGSKATGRGNLLSKSAPQTKHRTMFAIEDNLGNRRVVSLKGGQVTAWDHGSPENLGPIMHTEEGKAFEDKDGKVWTLTQATTKEIEKSTDLEYYHNALASALTSYLQLRKAERGFDFIESFKSDPDFKNIAVEAGKGNPPEGWKATDLPQLKGYFFEPHTAEVLDWYNKKLKTEGSGLLDRVGAFMRTAMLLNPLMHPANIAASWTMEKGIGGLLPHHWIRMGKAGAKAMRAVWTQNQDFLDALDAGAPLQSQRETTQQLSKLFFEQLSGAVESKEPWALRVAKSIGMSPITLVNTLHKLSGKAAWLSNDIFFLQSAFEKTAGGMPMDKALRETGRIIPEYRPPVRIFNSKTLGTVMTNKWATIFGAYHYSLLRSFGEMGKSMFGLHEPPEGESKVGDVAHGWGMFALLGLLAFGLYPALDELAKKATGDEKARIRRFGPLGVVDNAMQVARKEKSPTQALQSVVTPAPIAKAGVELAFNRDLYSGHQIYDPQAKAGVMGEQLGHYLVTEGMGTIGQGLDATQSESKMKKFKYSQVGVSFPRSGAEKIAQNIASAKSNTKAWTADERTKYYEKQGALDALRKGDTKPYEKLQADHAITHAEAHLLQKRAKLSWLQDKVHNFTYSETMEVYKAATPEQKKELEPILHEKRMNLLKKGRKAELQESQ